MTDGSRSQDRSVEARATPHPVHHAAVEPRSIRARRELNGHLVFLRGFLKHPRRVASVIPSSRFLEQRIVKLAGIGPARTIVELGPGTGGTTRAILRAMRSDATLLGVEIEPAFQALLGRMGDPRFIVHHGSAEDLRKALEGHRLPAPQAIISGIPFSTMSRVAAGNIARAIAEALAPGGRFVAYQFTDDVHRFCRPHLGRARVELELLNIPPVRVFMWEKDGVRRPF